MLKILITGANGMVGKNIASFYKAKKYKLLTPKSTELNLLNKNEISKYLEENNPDIIIHSAGIVGGIQANIKNPIKFLVDNTEIGINIIMSAKKYGIKNFINLASSCMYPKDFKNPLKEDYILEGKLEPTNEGYALAKITSTRLCEYISKENQKFLYKTIIPCNLYGKYDKFSDKNSHMIPAVIKKIHYAKLNNLPYVEIWGDGSSRREFMYAEDLADFIFYALDNFKNMPQNINVGLGYDYSINDYYKSIKKVLSYNGSFNYDLTKPTGMKRKLIDITKLKNFGWESKTSLESGIKKTYEFYLKNLS